MGRVLGLCKGHPDTPVFGDPECLYFTPVTAQFQDVKWHIFLALGWLLLVQQFTVMAQWSRNDFTRPKAKNLLDMNILAFIPTIFLGMFGGLGAFFVSLNIEINKFHMQFFNSIPKLSLKKTSKLLETVLILMNEYGTCIDPGLFAAIGAASFFSDVSRLTISLPVIMFIGLNNFFKKSVLMENGECYSENSEKVKTQNSSECETLKYQAFDRCRLKKKIVFLRIWKGECNIII
ncbi:hypothetical protein WISP_29297 [Willisornis vidua]|uniref:Uncharacterized protein n=1 Tax=Willisornis vidua TaxID=1566151 RepID=A0ABQ9DRU3_9PASS|nr:hypothetical protein WISP_29297 [Willisornis vidua]